jgi:hypothetical protein
MSKFLKIIAIIVIAILSMQYVAILMANGSVDPYYLRFTSSRKSSLILGTSKAAQGILPSVLDTAMDNHEGDFFNYAFTINISPYGKIYNESIHKKLDTSTVNGVFLLAVDPWSISSKQQDGEREAGFLNVIEDPNQYPNWTYFFKLYKKAWGRIILDRLLPGYEYLHQDGWLEVSYVPSKKESSKKLENKLATYRKRQAGFQFDEIRLDYLRKTIQSLRPYGSVVLVRLPISKEMQEIEDEYMPGFNLLMNQISNDDQVPYLDYSLDSDNYQYKDGNHLNVESAINFTNNLADRINKSL